MRHAAALTALCLAAALAACSKPLSVTGAAERASAAPAKPGRAPTLAYTREVDIQAAADQVAPVFEKTQAACAAAVDDECVVLDAGLATGPGARGHLVMRAKPAGIRRIIEGLRSAGGMVRESAKAEDLAAPIADGERRLAMLRDYRDSLAALRARGGNDIATLMKVNQELAETQSQLEAATGEQAHLAQRIATETLTIDIASSDEHGMWTPVGSALHEFGDHFAEALGGAITFVAYLVPWGVLLFAIGAAVRFGWRRLRRARRP